jgi:hypothetical protein
MMSVGGTGIINLFGGYGKDHINKSVFIDMIVLALQLPLDEECHRQTFFVPYSGNPGKAVRTGHSCAAVSHHRPTPRRPTARAKPIGALTPVKARGEEKPLGRNPALQATHAESEYLARNKFRPARLRAPDPKTSSQ